MKQRLLFCVPKYSAFTQPLKKALTSFGFDVIPYDYRKGTICTRAFGVLSNTLHFPNSIVKPAINAAIQKNLLKTAQRLKPKIAFIIKGETITTDTLNKLKNQGIITINWYPDWLDSRDWIVKHASFYHLFLAGCYDVYEELKRRHARVAYVPFAGYPDPQWKIRKKRFNISFIGHYTKRRERYFEAIRDLGLNIWGYKKWQTSKLADIAKPAVLPQKVLSILKDSKIAVNILTGSDSFQPRAINVRTFEATSIGTFLLVHKHLVIQLHFTAGKELVTFTTPDDLRKKTLYYLNHEREREIIAKAGWKRIKQEHTYKHRIEKIFSLLKTGAC